MKIRSAAGVPGPRRLPRVASRGCAGCSRTCGGAERGAGIPPLPGRSAWVAMKESNPREWRGLPCLRSRSTSAPRRGGAALATPAGQPSPLQRPWDTTVPLPPTAHPSLWGAARVHPPGGAWGGFTTWQSPRLCAGRYGPFSGPDGPCTGALSSKAGVARQAWLVTPRPHPGTAAPLSALMAPCGDTEVSMGFTTIPSIMLGGGSSPLHPPAWVELLSDPAAAAAVGGA